jgi:hypothetical protein
VGPALQQSATVKAASDSGASETTILVDRAMAPPPWVAAQRTLLDSSAEIAEAYAASNFDAAGHAIRTAPPAWGAGDGPDDIVNRAKDWPLAYILGGPESLVDTYRRIWEGHLEQYTNGKVPEVEAARDGIFRNDFITQYDWEHTSEELASFYMYSLARPNDPTNNVRAQRMAGLYLNEDPAAPNYDPETKIIRSLFNGSLGPRLTPVGPVDWEGLNPSLRFWSVAATDVRGDHPLNMAAAMLPFTAFLLTQDEKYRDWVLEYVGAWRDRTEQNDGNIPSNIGLDGTIGGEWGGKWYCGVWGWTGEGERNYVFRGPPEGFDAALLLSRGDPSYTQAMRHQIDNIFAAAKVVDGKVLVPHLYDDEGWGGYGEISQGTLHVQRGNGSGTQGNLVNILVDLYMTSMRPDDLERIPILPGDISPQRHGRDTPPGTDWINYIKGNDVDFPLRALESALAELRAKAVPAGADAGPPSIPPSSRAPTSAGWLGVDGQAYPSAISIASLDRLPPMRQGLGGCVPNNGRPLTTTSPAEVSPAAAAGQRGQERAAQPPGGGYDPGGLGGNGSIPVAALVQLTMGGANPGGESHGPLPLNVQVRHFDPERRRPGLPEDVGALVEHFDASGVTLTLVNANPLYDRTVSVQMGAYGEHTATEVTVGERTTVVDGPWFNVRLMPGSGETLRIGVRRYANLPTAAFPWDRSAR